MSISSVTIRCDHPGCIKTTDSMDFSSMTGWRRNEMSIIQRVTIALDFCPLHQGQHRVDGSTLVTDTQS